VCEISRFGEILCSYLRIRRYERGWGECQRENVKKTGSFGNCALDLPFPAWIFRFYAVVSGFVAKNMGTVSEKCHCSLGEKPVGKLLQAANDIYIKAACSATLLRVRLAKTREERIRLARILCASVTEIQRIMRHFPDSVSGEGLHCILVAAEMVHGLAGAVIGSEAFFETCFTREEVLHLTVADSGAGHLKARPARRGSVSPCTTPSCSSSVSNE